MAAFSSEKHGSKRNFKKFKPFKKLKWQKLQEHDYKVMAPMKAHKFKQSRKGTSYETSASLKDGNKAANKHAAVKSKVGEVKKNSKDYNNRRPNLKFHMSNIAKAMNRHRKKNLLGRLAYAFQNADASIENHAQSHALKSVITSQSSSRRGLLDALSGANISIENSVHNQAVKSKVLKQTELPKRGLLDALSGANISIENSVHNQAVKSKVLKQTKIPKRGLLDALSGANISIENSVHNQALKSKVLRQNKLPKRGQTSLPLNGANIFIKNSVHNQAVKSKVHNKPSKPQLRVPLRRRGMSNILKNADVSIQNSVRNSIVARTHIHRKHTIAILGKALKNPTDSFGHRGHSYTEKSEIDRKTKRVDVPAQKRDEEPFSDSKGVQLHGNSAMEVAGSVQLFLKYIKQFDFCISKYL